MKVTHKQQGFTLIEMLVVLAIIGFLILIVFAALNPVFRFQQSRDAVRENDVQEILTAVKLYQLDNGGDYFTAMQNLTDGGIYMMVNGGSKTSNCHSNNDYCDTNTSGSLFCLNIAQLVTEGYLPKIPVSPSGEVAWDEGEFGSDDGTGYTLQLDKDNDIVTIRSCESEAGTEIITAR